MDGRFLTLSNGMSILQYDPISHLTYPPRAIKLEATILFWIGIGRLPEGHRTMGSKFFGEFLIEKKVVTKEQLQEAVVLARKTNLLSLQAPRATSIPIAIVISTERRGPIRVLCSSAMRRHGIRTSADSAMPWRT